MSPVVMSRPYNVDLTYQQTVINDGPVVYWRMENAYNETYVDEMGNQDAVSSAPKSYNNGPSLVTDSTRSFRNSSAGSQFTILSAPALAASPLDIVGDITLEMWMEYYSTTKAGRLLHRPGGLSDGGGHVLQAIPAFGDMYITWGTQSTVRDYTRPVSDPIAPFTTIYHIVATLNATTNLWELWLNNVLVDSETEPAVPVSSSNTWYIGTRSDGNTIFRANASMDEVAIYNYVLSPGQIANHYAKGT